MSLDCTKILHEIHPTLTEATVSKSISDNTLDSLQHSIRSLKLEKLNRLKKVRYSKFRELISAPVGFVVMVV
jgi:hypothetical protein